MVVRKGYLDSGEICSISYLDERNGSAHLGEKPYFFPEMG